MKIYVICGWCCKGSVQFLGICCSKNIRSFSNIDRKFGEAKKLFIADINPVPLRRCTGEMKKG